MKKESTKPGQSDNETLKEIPKACLDETAAVEFLEKQRWGDIPACPHCGNVTVKKVTDGQGNRNRRFLWRCGDCKQQFTVRIGTVFEDSRIPLRIWCYAFWKACSSKKGISALQISRECSISYKSALFLMHRIRCAMTEPKKEGKLKGTVEADECYIGGKPRTRMSDTKRGLGTKKTPVMVMVERNGEARTKVLCRVNAKTLKTALTDNVHKCARLMTDEHRCYKWAGSHFNGGHETTIHSMGEYARGDVHSNTAESFFALLKRGVYGTFHAVSKKHLHRYVNEFTFRWNTRTLDDGDRVSKAIKNADGKRLMYRKPVSGTA